MLGDDRVGLVNADAESSDRGARAEVAHVSFVALDLLANAGELTLDIQHVRELAGARGEQLDEPLLEAAGIGDASLHVDVLLTDILNGDVHRLDLPDWGEK